MTVLNTQLIKKQGLSIEDVEELEQLHQVREDLFKHAGELMPEKYPETIPVLKTYVALLQSLEYDMQRLWKFPQTSTMHMWWNRIPHCICPTMDNDERLGTEFRVINDSCPCHGNKQSTN